MSDQKHSHARSFGAVAEAYDAARPSYPDEAVSWLVGPGNEPRRILELGAGTGKLTELLVAAGHQVIATDPLPEMLGLLAQRAPGAQALVGTAESIPVASRSVDVVISAQAFHWFDHGPALAEIARVLRPGGTFSLVWNARDEGIPWVRKLGRIIGNADNRTDLVDPLRDCEYFDDVAEREYRFWQDLRRPELFDLVRSRSYVAVLPEHEREDVLERVGALYDDYGRGPDGMKLPYLTRCYRTTVINQPPPPVVMQRIEDQALALMDSDNVAGDSYDPDATQAIPRPGQATLPPSQPNASGPEDTGTVLIDFR
ncbi:SAM-dependent methyltransferase [Marmoricola sp. OAE513]|uniref:class I SAM-dependent methyltransferase n=1 Tax=Marmoricola sp. OAE513 TaxID=2817894 RepID=UPI001AE284FC